MDRRSDREKRVPRVRVELFGRKVGRGGTAEFYPNFCDDPPNITYTGAFDWFAANGDEIYGTFDGYLTPIPGTPGVYDNHETATVTGGTGRFTNATGSFTLGGEIDFTTVPPSFVLPWQGTISTVGSNSQH